ncbi:hypothetical protein N7474_008122 [Penicillium riverlandense]|uniref:uncharacterized protein n=1 Tax=Penicillium riverlandense TaxID=1903569 RepID=UPI002546BD60|nr:uncharacterized protein N7474_008122 [Penicillium riverlandense]KAJ5811821.1 hypothetical protein N7474_008122 [Penicillium riverlandense]
MLEGDVEGYGATYQHLPANARPSVELFPHMCTGIPHFILRDLRETPLWKICEAICGPRNFSALNALALISERGDNARRYWQAIPALNLLDLYLCLWECYVIKSAKKIRFEEEQRQLQDSNEWLICDNDLFPQCCNEQAQVLWDRRRAVHALHDDVATLLKASERRTTIWISTFTQSGESLLAYRRHLPVSPTTTINLG